MTTNLLNRVPIPGSFGVEASLEPLLENLNKDTTATLKAKIGEIGKELDQGQNGIVYALLDSTTVLKLTLDAVEANAAHTLMKRPMPEAVNVFGVWNLGRQSVDQRTVFAIWMERLFKLPSSAISLFALWHEWSEDNFDAPLTIKFIQEFCNTYDIDSSAKNMKGKLIRWLMGAAKNLVARRIFDRDLHSGNVMVRKNGEFAIFDIGSGSEVPYVKIDPLTTAELLDETAHRLTRR